MKKFFSKILIALLSFSAFSELKYVEICSIQNLPVIKIKTIEDFEEIIKNYNIPIVFIKHDSETKPSFQSSAKFTDNSEALVLTGNTYFTFNLEGYNTLADYKAGNNANFKNSTDYMRAKSLGIENSEFFYYYSRNSFRNIEDANNAYKSGFVFYKVFRQVTPSEKMFLQSQKQLVLNENISRNEESDKYYDAKKLGYNDYSSYKEYIDYTANGFKTKDEYLLAKSKGFYRATDFKTATDAGFSDGEEYNEALKLGLKTKSDLTAFTEITSSIDKIISEKKSNKMNATIYYFIHCLPKGEMSISVLSKSLEETYSSNSDELKNALNIYENDLKNQRELEQKRQDRKKTKNLLNINTFFSTNNLKKFFNDNDISMLGSYSEKTEIFKRK